MRAMPAYTQHRASDSIDIKVQALAIALMRCYGSHDSHDSTIVTLFYSARPTPDPPISFGKSCIFGNPSLMRSFVSW